MNRSQAYEARIKSLETAKKGMEAIRLLILMKAPENKIIPMVIGTAKHLSPQPAREFINTIRRAGFISELGREACFELLKDHIGATAQVMH